MYCHRWAKINAGSHTHHLIQCNLQSSQSSRPWAIKTCSEYRRMRRRGRQAESERGWEAEGGASLSLGNGYPSQSKVVSYPPPPPHLALCDLSLPQCSHATNKKTVIMNLLRKCSHYFREKTTFSIIGFGHCSKSGLFYFIPS